MYHLIGKIYLKSILKTYIKYLKNRLLLKNHLYFIEVLMTNTISKGRQMETLFLKH